MDALTTISDFLDTQEQDFFASHPNYFNSTGYSPFPIRETAKLLTQLQERRSIPLNATFCDLGSGLGNQVIIASHLGLSVTGIEVDPTLYTASAGIIAKAKQSGVISPPNKINLHCANYLTRPFLGEYKPLLPSDQLRSIEETVSLSENAEEQDSLLIQLLKIQDVFFRYEHGPGKDLTIDQFKLYAKSSAKLILIYWAGNPDWGSFPFIEIHSAR